MKKKTLCFQTIGVAFAAKQIEINDRKITMGLWDTAGCER